MQFKLTISLEQFKNYESYNELTNSLNLHSRSKCGLKLYAFLSLKFVGTATKAQRRPTRSKINTKI